MNAAKCAHCGDDCKLVAGSIAYPHRRDLYNLFFWDCDKCHARVGCHKNGMVADGVKSDGTLPLGTAANAELRNARMAIHNEIDGLWKSAKRRGRARKELYTVLTNYGKIHGFVEEKEQYHTGNLTLQQCKLLLEKWPKIKRTAEERINEGIWQRDQ